MLQCWETAVRYTDPKRPPATSGAWKSMSRCRAKTSKSVWWIYITSCLANASQIFSTSVLAVSWAETWAKQQVGCTCCWERLHRDQWIAKWTNQGLTNGLLLPTCCQPCRWNFYLFWTLRLFYLIRNISPHSFTYLGCDFYQTVSYL